MENDFKIMKIVFWWDSFGSSVASLSFGSSVASLFKKGFRTLWYEFGLSSQSVRALVCLPIMSLAFVGTCDEEFVLKDVSKIFILLLFSWTLIYCWWFCVSITNIIELFGWLSFVGLTFLSLSFWNYCWDIMWIYLIDY